MLNPYCYYKSEPFYVARFIENDKRYLCGWDIDRNMPYLEHHTSVVKMASVKGYHLPNHLQMIELAKSIEDKV
jgi:hypothetical protein